MYLSSAFIFASIALKQFHKACLSACSALYPAHGERVGDPLEFLGVEYQIIRPKSCAFADGGKLGRAEDGCMQGREALCIIGKSAQIIYYRSKLLSNSLAASRMIIRSVLSPTKHEVAPR